MIWTHRWLAAKTMEEETTIKILGIDMSAAFDRINRRHLLYTVKSVFDEESDEYRLIQFLLSGTIIDTRINGTSTSKPFTSNVGIPQGDSLSAVLFTVYLEHALKEVRSKLPRPTSFEAEIPNEVAYAGDVYFIGQNYADDKKIQEVLKKYQIKVDTDKTELKREEGRKEVKTVESDNDKDVERRKQLATVALYRLHNVWIKGKKLKTSTKIKLYKSLIKPILLYNCGTWALTPSQEETLNAYHRKQLKKILNIRYPEKITNKSLYRICQEKPLSLQILSARWSLFGHILRRDKDIPANKATRTYFIPHGKKFRGRPKTTLPIVFNKDLALIKRPIRLTSSKDLAKITELAQVRERWRRLTSEIEKTAEVSQSKNWRAKRQ